VPGLGATGGKFQLSAGFRYANADKSYFNSRLNHDFTRLWQPNERLSVLDVTAQYRLNKRLSVTATMPIVFNRFSMLFPPLGVGRGTPRGWDVNGLSDISIYGQGLLLDPSESPFQNASLGVGIKIPSGRWNVPRDLPDETGKNVQSRSSYPPAILPGDGGVGILFGYNAFKVLRTPNLLRGVTLYSSGNYLANARDTNGTPSMVSSLGVPLSPIFLNRLTNSVADTYSLQAGASMPIPRTWDKKYLRGLRFRSSLNWEGLCSRDLIGKNNGFRQPGYALAIAPGVTYQYGRNLFILDVPIVFNRHINPNATLLPGLPTTAANGTLQPAKFNANRQMGLVAPVSISLRYVRTM
jgi:hypothetical protein